MYTCADPSTDSAKEVASDGLEVIQPGLEEIGYTRQSYQQQSASFGYSEEKAHTFAPVLLQETICGLHKVTFWLSFAITALVIIVAGVAIGLGVGLSQANKSNNAQGASAMTSAPATTTATQPVFNSTTTSSTASPSTTTISSPCPADNDTIHYEGTRKFRVLCDSDFTGTGKETLASTIMSSFYDCLGLCNSMNTFQDRSDVGCTYNREGTGGQSPGTCWCLGGKKTTTSNDGNDAAVPL